MLIYGVEVSIFK